MDLMLILDINEVGQKFRTKFNLYLKWNDRRLEFYNMKIDKNMNTFTKDEKVKIWVPVMDFRKGLSGFENLVLMMTTHYRDSIQRKYWAEISDWS